MRLNEGAPPAVSPSPSQSEEGRRAYVVPCAGGRGTFLRALLPVVVFLLCTPLLASGLAGVQLRPSAPVQEAYFAWDEGRYVDAIEGYLELLEEAEGERFVEEVARLTGELHPVRPVDDDGSGLAVSPDGRHLLWSRSIGEEWVTRVESVEGGGRMELPGRIATFTSGGEVAYLHDGILYLRNLDSGEERARELSGFIPIDLNAAPDGRHLYLTAGRVGGGDRLHIFRVDSRDGDPELLDLGEGHATQPMPAAGGRHLVFSRPSGSPLPAGDVRETHTPDPGLGIADLETGAVSHFDGSAPSVSADGGGLAFVRREEGGANRILWLSLDPVAVPSDGEPNFRVLIETDRPLQAPASSPQGDRVAYELQVHRDWEVFLSPTDGSGSQHRVTREIQHDRFPAWVGPDRLLGMKGEFRHRRAYLYDPESGDGYRLFHNNTLRTIAPEYEWAPHPDGDGVLVVAERDGDTIAPERAVWWVDLTRTVTRAELIERLQTALDDEVALLERGRNAFEPIAGEVGQVTQAVSVPRIRSYAEALYSFGGKFFTEPGNQEAIAYLTAVLEGWGYDVELQWFEPRGVRTANVVATLPGTSDPELVYVISSHFDSVLGSPGADDNSSGTTALLEAARVLRDHPRRATIQFAFLTAEEAGLLGAREFVRRALEDDVQIVGVLNNDMIGWTRSHRLDNTIRYSNPGIKDIQHAAAHSFSDLITYDALYYRGTDAAVFYDAYGDVVGGIGSYPVLGNPNYHQPTDQLETINQPLVAAVSRTTVASIMLLADSPARLIGLDVVESEGSGVEVLWDVAPESGITGYRVEVQEREGEWREVDLVPAPSLEIEDVSGLVRVRVRAVRDSGTEGWDWAYGEIP